MCVCVCVCVCVFVVGQDGLIANKAGFLGSISCHNIKVVGNTNGVVQSRDGYHFTITGQRKSIDLVCNDAEDRDNWIRDIQAAAGEETFVEAVASKVLTPDRRQRLKVHERTGLWFEESYPSGDLGLLCLPVPSPSAFLCRPLLFSPYVSSLFVSCVCMCVCLCVCTCTCTSTLHTCAHRHIYTQICIHMHACE